MYIGHFIQFWGLDSIIFMDSAKKEMAYGLVILFAMNGIIKKLAALINKYVSQRFAKVLKCFAKVGSTLHSHISLSSPF